MDERAEEELGTTPCSSPGTHALLISRKVPNESKPTLSDLQSALVMVKTTMVSDRFRSPTFRFLLMKTSLAMLSQ